MMKSSSINVTEKDVVDDEFEDYNVMLHSVDSESMGGESENDMSSSAGVSENASSSGRSDSQTTETSFSANTKGTEGAGSLSREETLAVNRSKMMVYAALLLAAAIVSGITYQILAKEEERALTLEFQGYSREILHLAQENSAHMFEELWDLGKSITSHAKYAKMSWPNVTLPDFYIRSHDERSRIGMVGFAPFVKPEQKLGWEAYSIENQNWIEQDYSYYGWTDTKPDPIPAQIHQYEDSNEDDPWIPGHRRTEVYDYSDASIFEYEIPLWQVSPPPKDTSIINLDLATHPVSAHLLWDVRVQKVDQYSRVMDIGFFLGNNTASHDDGHPHGMIYEPVFEDFDEDSKVVGFLIGEMIWDNMFRDVLSVSSAPLVVEIVGDCSVGFGYMVTGDDVIYLGPGTHWHEPRFEKYKLSSEILVQKDSRDGHPPVVHEHRSTDATSEESYCTYVMNTYPTEEFEEKYTSNRPIYFTIAIASVFVCTALVFIIYDWTVQRRQNKLLTTARHTNAIISSLFPKSVQNKLMKEQEERAEQEKASRAATKSNNVRVWSANRKGREMTNFLAPYDSGAVSDEEATTCSSGDVGGKGMPIADLFPEATVFFGDIAGFTAWSSMREPTQVFILLETIYNTFDLLANKRRVFKVETVGDCYVAVCGLPEPRSDHAVVMARFAKDCLEAMAVNLHALEKNLGPDTTELALRIGIHSGPVTAGVLRGDRARFQLFGDTVNTASRIETTGERNRIHISEATANLLIAAGKTRWITERMNKVQAKGKGELRTFWMKTPGTDASSMGTSSHADDPSTTGMAFDNGVQPLTDKHSRLVSWITEVMTKLLKHIVAKRAAADASNQKSIKNIMASRPSTTIENKGKGKGGSGRVLDEVVDIIMLPKFDARASGIAADDVELKPAVTTELREYIYTIASMYSHNPFHNFEHAAHVTMSVVKLLSRIVSPEIEQTDDSAVHDYSYGITSDPLTQFAVVLSALIHDIYHPGVPNAQLVKEGDKAAKFYKNKGVAEQKSVDMAWKVLMEPAFSNLRSTIYTNVNEYKRFRQLVVNSVMATDICDKEIGAARKARWNKAFSSEQAALDEDPSVTINRKATIVIEHIIQASDISHTMQHWHIYRKFNQRLFEEMYLAYKQGRSDTNPADFWYEGELGFFNHYIIPLTQKLKDCGVFGVSSDEYLNYALENRKEWTNKGRQVVAEMLLNLKDKFKPKEGGDVLDVSKRSTEEILGIE